ncbi:unnamed protein product [Urochloa humidicola]
MSRCNEATKSDEFLQNQSPPNLFGCSNRKGQEINKNISFVPLELSLKKKNNETVNDNKCFRLFTFYYSIYYHGFPCI